MDTGTHHPTNSPDTHPFDTCDSRLAAALLTAGVPLAGAFCANDGTDRVVFTFADSSGQCAEFRRKLADGTLDLPERDFAENLEMLQALAQEVRKREQGGGDRE